jgi:alkylhydroperoxidase family enzyme
VSSARVPRPERDALDADVAALLDLVTKPDGTQLDTVAALAHQPALMGPFLGWAAALALNGALPKRDHELLALRTAVNCHSSFEWDEHEDYARDAGLTDVEIDAVRAGPEAGSWAEHERALLRAADELNAEHGIGAATWDALAAHYDVGQLVEIPYVVGQYTMLSLVANVLDPHD